jgi:predicted O-linked N-acetylglucosamine transferase (SPINDLY family)
MSILIEVNTHLEQRLRERALKQGIEVNQYISQFLEQVFPNKAVAQPSISSREATLMQQIDLDIAPEQWKLYLALKTKKQKGKLPKTQQIQFTSLCELIENANAKRIAVLAELSQIRKIPIRVLMEQLGLNPHHE